MITKKRKRKRELQYYTVILVYENETYREDRSYYQTLAYSWKDAKKRAEKKAVKKYFVKWKLKKVEL